MSNFEALLARVKYCVGNKRMKRAYPEDASHKEHHLMVYDKDHNLVLGVDKHVVRGEGMEWVAYDPANPQPDKLEVGYIAHRLYRTDVVTYRWDGAVQFAEYNTQLTQKFAWEYAPRWTRPYYLCKRDLPKHADQYVGRLVHTVELEGRKQRLLSTGLWLRQIGAALCSMDEVTRDRYVLEYAAPRMTKEAKAWRRANRERVHAVYTEAAALVASLLVSGAMRGLNHNQWGELLRGAGWADTVPYVIGQLPTFAGYFDAATIAALGRSGTWEQVPMELEL